MWSSLNYSSHTVFLEEDKAWIEKVVGDIPSLDAYHVSYDTKFHQAGGLVDGDEDCKPISDPKDSK
ncbi:Glucuronoxylan 4-O-methyltransferase 2 [Linum grandiflorum]